MQKTTSPLTMNETDLKTISISDAFNLTFITVTTLTRKQLLEISLS